MKLAFVTRSQFYVALTYDSDFKIDTYNLDTPMTGHALENGQRSTYHNNYVEILYCQEVVIFTHRTP